MTGREAVATALRKIGVLAPGETMSASEATDGLSELNRMLGSFSNEKLIIHEVTEDTAYTLTPSDGSYTMGAGGNINTARPIGVLRALIRDSSQNPAVDYELDILNAEQWAGIAQKSSEATIPRYLYMTGSYPLQTLNLWPVPSAAYKLVLFSEKPLTSISTLDTSISLPPGYDDMLISNLGVRLAPEYGKTAPAELVMMAQESKASIMRVNHRPAVMKCDPALTGGGGAYDIYSGGFR